MGLVRLMIGLRAGRETRDRLQYSLLGRALFAEGAGMAVVIDGGALGFAEVVAVAREGAALALGPQARARMAAAHAHVAAAAAQDGPVYGITTGFGGLAGLLIPAAQRTEMQ